MGYLEKLPLELLDFVLLDLDLQSLTSLRLINRRGKVLYRRFLAISGDCHSRNLIDASPTIPCFSHQHLQKLVLRSDWALVRWRAPRRHVHSEVGTTSLTEFGKPVGNGWIARQPEEQA